MKDNLPLQLSEEEQRQIIGSILILSDSHKSNPNIVKALRKLSYEIHAGLDEKHRGVSWVDALEYLDCLLDPKENDQNIVARNRQILKDEYENTSTVKPLKPEK